MNPIHLAIIEDDVLIQDSLRSYFEQKPNTKIVVVSNSVEAFLTDLQQLPKLPAIVLLDINLPGISGVDGIPLIKRACPDIDIIMLTTFEETDVIFKALSNGACSYVSKRVSLEKISEAVSVVHEGGSYMSPSIARKIANFYMPKSEREHVLTSRQMQIVNGIVSGKSYKAIAEELFVSLNTVRSHIKNIYNLLDINSKAELINKSFNKEL
ncbi:MAG: response regulator transcription factor [Marinirhabdus sp.]|nr:response regulator transcription factor [Marinirhabdus sp.]